MTADEIAAECRAEALRLMAEGNRLIELSLILEGRHGLTILNDPSYARRPSLEIPDALGDPPPDLADAWERFQRGEKVEPYEIRKIDEWRAERAEEAGY